MQLWNTLRPILLFLVLLIIGGYAYYNYVVPCHLPLGYRVGTIDQGFGLSEAELRSALSDAEAVWEDAAGVELFEYSERASLPVNLLYDSRQAITKKNNEIKEVIDSTTDSADALKRQYNTATAQYESARSAYLAARAAYEQSAKAYSDSVAYWNSRGGAPQSEYRKLQTQQSALEKEGSALEAKRLALNALANSVNSLGDRYNALVKDVNAHVSVINQTAGREFEEGLYTKNGWSSKIDIFEYQNRDELVRVLAHELGHALGMGHNANPDSIMYELNQSDNATPTADDLADLRAACRL